jgi:hypothetical protein
LMLNVFFYGGSFMKTITDVDVHEHLKLAKRRRANQCLLGRLYTRMREVNAADSWIRLIYSSLQCQI